MRTRLNAWLLLVALCLVTIGCGGGSDKQSVSGTVTFDGQPVPEGEIIFRPADNKGQSDAGRINDGKFSFQSTPGAKKVSITGMRDVPGKFDDSNPGSPKTPVRESFIPEKYNSRTELTAEVGAGSREFQFDLKSK